MHGTSRLASQSLVHVLMLPHTGQLSESSRLNASCMGRRTCLSLNGCFKSCFLILLGASYFHLVYIGLMMHIGGSIGRIRAGTTSLKAVSLALITLVLSIVRNRYPLVGPSAKRTGRRGWLSTASTCMSLSHVGRDVLIISHKVEYGT